MMDYQPTFLSNTPSGRGRSKARARLSCSVLAFACLLPQAAAAQEAAEDGGLQDIVVTAQKRTENLQTVPIAVSAVSSEQLQAAGIVSTTGLATVVSGFSVNNSVQNFSPHVRGIGTTSIGPGIENPVALYVDGVYYASQIMGLTDMSDVSQVAVLKGPQGTLFGRNATGGVIQLTTRDPSQEFGGEFRSELDQYLTNRNYLYMTGGRDDLAVNVSVRYATQGEGWGKNLATGEDIHKINHDTGVRTKWVYTPTEATKIKLAADYSDQSNSLGPNLRPIPGTTPLLAGFTDNGNIFNVNSFVTNHSTGWNGGGSLTVDQDAGFARLVSISAYRKYKFSTRFSSSISPQPAVSASFTQAGKQFSQELQLISPDSDTFTWVAGAYYFWGREGLPHFATRFFNGFVLPFPFSGFDVKGSESTESIAGFGQATYSFTPDTRLTVGLRYTHERRTMDNAFLEGFMAAPDGSEFSIGPISPIANEAVKFNRLTWRLSLDHKFSDDVMGYVSYNRGFKSGGLNVFNSFQPPFKPEQLDAYEVGMKTELFDRRLRFNPSIFYYDYKQIQMTRFENNTIILNGEKAELYGVDLDVEAALTDRLTLTGGAEWLHAKLKKFTNATCAVTPFPFPQAVLATNPGGGVIQVPCDASGNRIPFAPKVTLNIGVNYEVPVAGAKVVFNVTNAYSSSYFGEPDNVVKQKGFNMLNGSVTWTAPGDRLSVGAFLRNALDKVVFGQMSAPPPSGFQADYSNPPRTYGVNLTYRFGAF